MKRRLPAVPIFLTLGAALTLASCSGGDDTDLRPPPGYAPPPFHPLSGPVPRGTLVRYGEGFYGLEAGSAGATWRWMSKRGTVHLPNDHHDRRLHLEGWVPLALLNETPTLRITLEGVELDRFVAAGGTFTRDYTISRARLGDAPAVRLTIETSTTAHAPGDIRELGVSLTALNWHDGP